MKDLTTALGLEPKAAGTGWVFGDAPAEAVDKGVWVYGKEVAAHEDGGEVYVPIQDFVSAAGMQFSASDR